MNSLAQTAVIVADTLDHYHAGQDPVYAALLASRQRQETRDRFAKLRRVERLAARAHRIMASRNGINRLHAYLRYLKIADFARNFS